MQSGSLEQLLETVEQARLEVDPELDPEFLRDVVRAEEAHPEDDREAVAAIEQALESMLGRIADPG